MSDVNDPIDFGPFVLNRKIVAGGMAEVWDAKKTGMEGFGSLALKVILPHHAENHEFVEMFLDEGRLAAMLDHPNICQISELGRVKDTYYLAMEYIDGIIEWVDEGGGKTERVYPLRTLLSDHHWGLFWARLCTFSNRWEWKSTEFGPP